MNAGRPPIKGFYRRSPARAFAGILLDWAIVVVLVAAAEWFLHPTIYLAAILLIAGRMMSLETKWTHEAMHFNLFRKKSWNDRLEFLFAWPVCTSASLGRENHLRHHLQYLEEKEDPVFCYEYAGITPEKKNGRAFMVWIWFIRPLIGYQAFHELRAIVDNLIEAPSFRWKMLFFWSLVVGVFAAVGRPDLLVWYWVVPLFLIRPIFWFWQDLAQHYNARSPLGTRDLHGWFFTLFFGDSRNYHGVHHVYPALPWYRLAECHRLYVGDDQVDVATGFLDLTRQILTIPKPRPS
jgi:fatty acid desaturase